MIIRPVREGVQLIHQHDHARAAGTLVRRWQGTPSLPALPTALLDPLFFAADNHDVGWCRLDSAPRIDLATGLPQSFFAATAEEAVSTWTEGIRFCEAHSPFSGYLVSLHFTSLAEAALPGAPEEDLALLGRFAEEERERRKALLRESSPQEAPLKDEAARLLRVCDTLSLIACRAPEISPPPGEVQFLTRGGMKICLTREGALEIAPWPFQAAAMQLLFPGFTLPPARYESQIELDEALRQAEPAIFETRLAPLAE